MLFWTVVLFITYSLIYFVVSQKKIRRLQNSNLRLSTRLEKTHMQMAHKGQFEHEITSN